MQGYTRLLLEMQRDCLSDTQSTCHSISLMGCTQEGHTCSQKYCDKLAWIIDRATHYGDKLGLSWEVILDSWEKQRHYWYMNYYQSANIPRLDNKVIRIFQNQMEYQLAVKDSKFRCPTCKGESSSPYHCTNKHNKGSKCTPTTNLYGAKGDVYVFIRENLQGYFIFMPIHWEL